MEWYLVRLGEILEVCNTYEEAAEQLNEYDEAGVDELEIYSEGAREWRFDDFRAEVARSKAKVRGMQVVASVRRLERSEWVYPWDDTDMDTTETLYRDKGGNYFLRYEQYHDFMLADDVEDISRREANEWKRKNARRLWRLPHPRRRQTEEARRLQA